MLQLEAPHHQFSLASSNPPDTTRGALGMLSDSEMSRFSEFLEGCPPTLLDRISNSRSSSFAEIHTHLPLEHEHDHPLYYQHDQEHHRHHDVAPQFVHDHVAHSFPPSSGGGGVDALAGSDWANSGLAADGESMVPPFSPALHSSVSFASGFSRDTTTSSIAPYCDLPCWFNEQGAVSGDGVVPLAVGAHPSDHGEFSHFATSSFERVDKSDNETDVSSVVSLDAPAPAHMEQHLLPYVRHVEADMVFAGMDVNNVATHQSYYDSRERQHYLEHRQHDYHDAHERLIYSASPSETSERAGFERMGAPHQQQHSFTLQLDGVSSASHTTSVSSSDTRTVWRSSDQLAPTHFITSGASESSSPSSSLAPVQAPAACGARGRTLRARESTARPARPATFAAAPTRAPSVFAQRTRANSNSNFVTSAQCGDATFPAQLRLLTALNDCYWKNGRKNLQCFPVCPEHNDFYSMKMNNRKHSSVGVCRGPVYCHVLTAAASPSSPEAHAPGSSALSPPLALSPTSTALPSHSMALAALPAIPSGQHMKYEHGIGASSSGGSTRELFVLGRFERVPQRDNTDLVGELRAPPEFATSAAFEEFRYGCFQAVEMRERRVHGAAAELDHNTDGDVAAAPSGVTPTTPMVRSTWFFLPDVWKVQPMLKKKRKATRSAPAQTFPFCFRVFVYTARPSANSSDDNGSGGYTCVASSASTFFELYSTRTVDRVKRKYWSKATDDDASCASSTSSSSSAFKRQRR